MHNYQRFNATHVTNLHAIVRGNSVEFTFNGKPIAPALALSLAKSKYQEQHLHATETTDKHEFGLNPAHWQRA